MEKRIQCRGLILKQLPVEIIEEILLKLPINSILRFKCVSKSWRCSISSKGFIREHLNKSNSMATDFTHGNLILTYYETPQINSPSRNIIGSCSIESLLNDDNDDDEPNPSNLSIPNPIQGLEDTNAILLLASCNGLIFITENYREMYLWNPSTRKIKNIRHPLGNSSLVRDHPHWWCGHGLGYVESTDDYKIICFLSCRKLNLHLRMYTYSSRTGSWKTIPELDNQFDRLDSHATFVNGKLYWLAKKKDLGVGDAISWSIVSLDLVEEKYEFVALPHFLSVYYPRVLKKLGGYLSLIGFNCRMDIGDVWVMKEASWSKIWTFSDPLSSVTRPLWLKKNGDIVVAQRSDLVIYCGKDDKVHQSPIDKFGGEFRSITFCVQSLVSPF